MHPQADLLDLYTWLHAHPELSGYETLTSARIAAELAAAGFDVTTGVGGTGVVGVLLNGAGPVVLVRTDMDALPVTERTGLPYASTRADVMHACGHDLHMTISVGVARALAASRSRWSGTLILVGQPAEETGAGARAMLDDGLFTRFPRPHFNLALHADPCLEAGKLGYREGYVFASSDFAEITVRGTGGHAAYPHLAHDPIVIAAETVLALQTIVSREVRPLDPVVVTVGSIHGGTKHNIIPEEVRMQLTIRSYDPQVRQTVVASIGRIANGIAAAHGVPEDRMPLVVVARPGTPSVYNAPELADRLVPVWRSEFGVENVLRLDPEMGFEDFSEYGLVEPKIPSFLFRLGTVDANRIAAAKATRRPLPGLHSSEYRPVPEPSISTGVSAMVAAVLELMR
jgi:amidohydrolase